MPKQKTKTEQEVTAIPQGVLLPEPEICSECFCWKESTASLMKGQTGLCRLFPSENVVRAKDSQVCGLIRIVAFFGFPAKIIKESNGDKETKV